MTHLTVLHLLLIVIGVITVSTIGYRYVSNINEPFYVDTTPTCPLGKKFAVSSGTCMDSTNPSLQTASAPICPAGSNLNPATGKCVTGAPALPDQYWLPAEQRKSTTTTTATPATTATTATTALKTATTAPTCYDPSGNVVSLTSLVGLSGAPSSSGNATVQNTIPTCPTGQTYNTVQQMCVSTTPTCPEGQTFDTTQGLCVGNIPAFSSTQSIASNKVSDSTLLQNIQEIVRNELLSQSGMTTGSQLAFLGQKNKRNRDEEDDSENSPANHQGREFARDCPKNTSVPDMSKYVRKDSIPCWGCNLE